MNSLRLIRSILEVLVEESFRYSIYMLHTSILDRINYNDTQSETVLCHFTEGASHYYVVYGSELGNIIYEKKGNFRPPLW